MPQGLKVYNEYALAFQDYDRTPKAVIAALAMSLALRLSDDDFDAARAMLREEWSVLHDAGVIPQEPA